MRPLPPTPALRLLTLLLAFASFSVAQVPITLTSTPNPSTFGQTVTLTATVANSSGLIVRFLDGGAQLGSSTTNAFGVATFPTSVLTIGTHTLTASYTPIGSAGGAVNSQPVTQVVTPPSPSVTFTSSPNPSNYCGTVLLTATVTPPTGANAGIPTGSITFRDGSATLSTANMANGTATFSTSSLSAGNHLLAAAYSGDANYSANSATSTQTVNQAATATSLTATPNPAGFGQTVTLNAAVTSPCGATGTVTFFDGNTALGTASLANGTASFATASLAGGTRSLTARYNGDTNNAASTSPAVNLAVNKTATTTTLSSSANPSAPGQSITLTARVTPASATGTVTFFDGGSSLGTANLSSGGAALAVSFSGAGTHSLTATYGGDANFASSVSAALSQVVSAPQSSTTTLTVSPNPAAPAQTVTLTASVSPASASGTVTFQDGSATLATITLANGSAVYTTASLTAGAHSLTATYNGSTSLSSSVSAPVTLNVARSSTTTTLTVSPNPAGIGQAVTLTATVAPAAAAGTVTFRDGTTAIGTGTLSNSTATFTTSTLPLGSHSLTASYEGNSSYGPSASSTVNLAVGRSNTNIVLTASPTSAVPGQQVVLTATVTPASVTGTVTFLDRTTSIGTGTLQNGVATFTTSTLSVGNHSLTASYPGDSANAAATSSPVIVSVGLPATLVTLAASPGTVSFGQTVSLTARVTPTSATGTVTFFDGSTSISTSTVSGGIATAAVNTLAVGTHTLKATYDGDAANGTSSSNTVTVTVTKAASSLTLTASPNPSSAGQSVTLTASVTPAGATGSVAFLDGTSSIGTASLSGGRATFTTSSLAQGSHSLTASYAGDANVNSSVSAAVTQTVNPATSSLSITGPASLPNGTVNVPYPGQVFAASGGVGAYVWSLVPGGSTTSDLQLSPTGALTGTPLTAGTFQITVQVRDSIVTSAVATRSYTVNFSFPALPSMPLTINAPPQTPADQPVVQIAMAQPYAVPLRGTFAVSFSPNAAALPSGYTNAAVQFSGGGTTATVSIPANSTAPVSLPAIQIGSVAGEITVRLTGLANASTGQSVPLPTQVPTVTINVPRIAPVIVPGSVRIANITAAGFQVVFDANSTPRDIVRANITFTAAPGATLTGNQTYAVDLASAGSSWFPSSAGVSAGGAFSVTITFGFTGDTSALGSASVTLTNSAGTSAAVSGGR